jgi:hypothetical protein
VAPLPAPSPTEAFDDATAGGALDVLRPGKLSVHGAFTASMRGGDPVLGQDIGLRYGALGTAIRVLKFGGDSQVMGVGLVAELQHRPSRSPVELLVGGSAMVAAPNGATNPAFEGLLGAHVGATKQLTYRIRGVAQPYISPARRRLAHLEGPRPTAAARSRPWSSSTSACRPRGGSAPPRAPPTRTSQPDTTAAAAIQAGWPWGAYTGDERGRSVWARAMLPGPLPQGPAPRHATAARRGRRVARR